MIIAAGAMQPDGSVAAVTTDLFDAGEPRETATVTFGAFRLDVGRRLLADRVTTKPIGDKLLKMLLIFIESRGEIVSKRTLAERIWPGQTVSVANVNQHVFMLRQLLGESARDHSYIITQPRKGFRFAVPVAIVEQRAVDPEQPATWGAPIDQRASSEAFRLYCRGCHLLETQDLAAVERAVTAFEGAHDAEPSNPLPLTGAAQAVLLLGEQQYVAPQYTYFKARTYLDAALKVAPTSATPRALLAQSLALFAWDFEGARRELERARQLRSPSVANYHASAWLALCARNVKRALSEAERALSLHPSSLALQIFVGRVLMHAERFDDALDIFDSIIAGGVHSSLAREQRARALLLSGNAKAGIDEVRALEGAAGPEALALLARAYADTGQEDLIEAVYRQLVAIAERRYVSPVSIAVAAAAYGRAAEALAQLSRAFIEHDPNLLQLALQPGVRRWFRNLESIPDFQKLLWALPSPHQ